MQTKPTPPPEKTCCALMVWEIETHHTLLNKQASRLHFRDHVRDVHHVDSGLTGQNTYDMAHVCFPVFCSTSI